MNRKFFTALLSAALAASLTLPVGALSVSEALSLLEERYVESLPPAAYGSVSVEELLSTLGDPYTVYYTPEQYDRFLTAVHGEELVGIGISLRTVFEEGYEILSVFPDSPARNAGLVPGEKITGVNGLTLTPGDSPSALIAGPEGSAVTLTLRGIDGGVREVTMTRRTVQVPLVTYEQLGTAGYLLCDSFGESAPEGVRDGLTVMDDGSAVWVLDLQKNPGGTSTAAAEMAGAFLGQQVMVYFRDADGALYKTATVAACVDMTDKPLIVLTGQKSASASELFSAAIRDHRGGISIGARTTGKGVAQTVFDRDNYPELFDGDALKVTTYRFFSPAGTTNHLLGIIPTLLMEEEYAQTAALLLSAPKPERSLNHWKLEISGQTFYLDRELAMQEPEALTALVEALPPSAVLSRGTGTAYWRQTDIFELCAEFGLIDYTPRTFSDIAGHPYEEQINTLCTYSLLSGDEQGLFHPGRTMTRAELASLLCTALNLPESGGTFSDVDPQAWYAGAVNAVAARGFMSGTGNGTFSPDAPLTNQEFYTVCSAVAAWANLDGYEWSQKDVSAVQWAEFYAYPEWAQGPARNLDKLGVEVDREDPTAPVTRGDAAGVLCTLFENIHILWNK